MAKARAIQKPLVKATRMVGNPKEGQPASKKVELAALRESLKAQMNGRVGGKKAKAILDQIQKRYGDAEMERAVREFNAAFRGVPRDPDQGKNPRHG
jgi:hypothetical protein